MQKPEQPKKRNSILKKRRSRSLSPNKSITVEINQRRSRRISFSGKNAVREFTTNIENKGETIWGIEYEESAKQSSNEQITLQSTVASCIDQTKNETTAMDVSDLSNFGVAPHSRPSTGNYSAMAPTSIRPSIFSQQALHLPKPTLFQQKRSESVSFAMNASVNASTLTTARQSILRNSIVASSTRIEIQEKENVPKNEASSVDMEMSIIHVEKPVAKKSLSIFEKAYKKREENKEKSLTDEGTNRISMDISAHGGDRLDKTSNNIVDLSMDQTNFALPRYSVIQSVQTPRKQSRNDADVSMNTTKINDDGMQMSFYPKGFNESVAVEQPKVKNPSQQQSIDVDNPFIKMYFNRSSKLLEESCENLTNLGNVIVPETQDDQMQMSEVIVPETQEDRIDVSGVIVPATQDNQLEITDVFVPPTQDDQLEMTDVFVPETQETENNVMIPETQENEADEDRTLCNDVSLDMSINQSLNAAPKHRSVRMEESVNRSERKSISQMNLSGINISDKENMIHPPTQKKQYDLNRTPFYKAGDDDENDTTLTNEGSSIDMSNVENEQSHYNEKVDEPNGCAYAHQTISDTMEIIDASIVGDGVEVNESLNQSPVVQSDKRRRETCYQEASMEEDVPTAVENRLSHPMDVSIAKENSLIERITEDCSVIDLSTPDLSLSDRPIAENSKKPNRGTIFASTSMQLDDSLEIYSKSLYESIHHITMDMDRTQNESAEGLPKIGNLFANVTKHCNATMTQENPVELTFIGDEYDDDENMLCNTKFDLHESESNSLNSLPGSMESILKLDKGDVFKTKDLLRRSLNLIVANAAIEYDKEKIATEQSDAVLMPPPQAAVAPTATPLSNLLSNNCSRRSGSVGSAGNETSYLMNATDDIPIGELKLDWSSYDKFKGLATPQDVIKNFAIRMDKIRRKGKESVNQLQNEEQLTTQNVEAPSWVFLMRNKIEEEHERVRAEVQQVLDEREIEAYLPIIPDISLLVHNKCLELKNWTFDEIWYFRGNIHLRSKLMPAFKIVILYNGKVEDIDRSVQLYGALKFTKIMYQLCPLFMKIDDHELHLMMRELQSKLPKDLLRMCETSADLSRFDDELHSYIATAHNKVKELEKLCPRHGAWIIKEEDSIYIWKFMSDDKRYLTQEYIIDLVDIDGTNWRNVRTKPRRLLHNDVKSLPNGMAFLTDFLQNDKKYVPME